MRTGKSYRKSITPRAGCGLLIERSDFRETEGLGRNSSFGGVLGFAGASLKVETGNRQENPKAN
jgi:hypothetical protein